MKPLILILLIWSSQVWAVTPPSQQTVDGYIALSQTLSDAELEGSGRWSCQHSIPIDGSFKSYGKNQQEALTRSALKCIKNKCNQMPSLLSNARSTLSLISDEELARLMKGQGYGPGEISSALRNRKNPNNEYIERTSTCTGGSPTLRMFAVDMCFSVPFECHKK